MKKLLSFALVLVTVFAFSACGAEHDFRNVDLGMTVDEVKKAEQALTLVTETSEESATVLEYTVSINSADFQLMYVFSNNSLNLIVVNNKSPESYAADYSALKEYFSKAYGEPSMEFGDTAIWDCKNINVSAMKFNDKKQVNALISKKITVE